MTENSMELPQECWELIISSLSDQRHFESLSLLSHTFLSITNHLRSSFKITDPALPLLPHLFLRFKNIKKIDLSHFQPDPDPVLCTISRSGLDLESLNISNLRRFPQVGLRELGSKMKNLKELNCSRIWGLKDDDLYAISDSCLSLEALDISFPEYVEDFPRVVTDSGVVALSKKLTRLTKIDVSGNMFITDKSLVSISMNCVMLRDFSISECDFITQKGIVVAMKSLPNLVSVCVGGIGIPSIDLCFKESFDCVKGMCVIEFSNSFISDELLRLLANACLPLKKVVFSHCYNFSFAGICYLLSKYRFLEYLNLEVANFLNDGSMIELSKYLCRLKYINLDYCSKLTNLTFFTLIRDCPVLSEIRMETTNLGVEEFTTELAINPRVKSLHLARNGNLSDEFLKKVAFLCPNLQLLDVSSCATISEEGIGEVLKSCSDIQRLEIKLCRHMSSLGITDFEVKKLEVLRVGGSGIDDDALTTIANTCPGLLYLNLYNCLYVTTRGVKEVVEKCRALRGISLWCCQSVDADILPWMVFSRPSLRNIVSPSNQFPTENQRNLLLRHGCVVSCINSDEYMH
ncbi:hypothetical protein Dsin_028162 [Dipteronia sinensis]|uniref:F-box/LRR-repeat protein 15-like leucin rich repeat domain-containing protein n=1 Tax=Dipteronia sinensis TaxID=43782 RepID=A0AAD9ZRP7_9ROSI|nr:hypothetical protein Dsin_028162 [Dipteronia sinensis]